MKVALVYDRVNKWGGAERVLLALHELFPDAPLYTSVYDNVRAPWANVFTIKTSFLQNFPFAKSRHELYALLMPLAFESFSFDEYDLVISISSEAAKGIITKPHTKHISYLLTPTRYLWSGYKEYFRSSAFAFLAKPAVYYLRKWDLCAAERSDSMIAISNEVKNRIKKYYNRTSPVIYPPVKTLSAKKSQQIIIKGNFFLIVSRLVPYKKIDLAIKACNSLKLPLKIVGMGSEFSYLEKIAGPTVEFLGSLTDEELVNYYRSCKALLFPGDEDFGIVVVEAQSFGKPVIAYGRGGAVETIIAKKTGELFFPQTKKALTDKLEKFKAFRYNTKDCEKNAKRFSLANFKKQFLNLLETL